MCVNSVKKKADKKSVLLVEMDDISSLNYNNSNFMHGGFSFSQWGVHLPVTLIDHFPAGSMKQIRNMSANSSARRLSFPASIN